MRDAPLDIWPPLAYMRRKLYCQIYRDGENVLTRYISLLQEVRLPATIAVLRSSALPVFVTFGRRRFTQRRISGTDGPFDKRGIVKAWRLRWRSCLAWRNGESPGKSDALELSAEPRVILENEQRRANPVEISNVTKRRIALL